MFDAHTHVLPQVDDGAGSPDETRSMLLGLKNLGYSHVVATPHWAVGMPDVARSIVEDSAKIAASVGITLMVARECRIHPNLPEHVKSNPSLRIAGGNVVLVELPWGPIPTFTFSTFKALLGDGYRPVLVHPERHAPLWDEDSPLDSLFNLGVALQVNLQSLNGAHGSGSRDRAISLLEQGKVTLVASDIHSAEEIENSIPAAHRLLKNLVGEEVARILTTDNPEALLNDTTVINLADGDVHYIVDRSWIKEPKVFADFLSRIVRPLRSIGGRMKS